MIAFRLETEVREDRRVEVTLPAEVPPGKAELVIVVNSTNGVVKKRPRGSLAEWADANAEHWGNQLSSENAEGFTGRRF